LLSFLYAIYSGETVPSLLGIDNGLTVSKAVVFDIDGTQLSVARRRIPQSMPRPRWVERDMLGRIDELFERYSRRKVSLVGWSLGGLYARQLAKSAPDKVRGIISLGSPFAGSPKSTNAWRAYEMASGNKVEEHDPFGGTLAGTPPVPTTSIFSRSDGICAWQACLNEDGPESENIEVYGSHCGLGHHPAAVYAIADRLAQPEGQWKKFDRRGWRALAFPDWQRS